LLDSIDPSVDINGADLQNGYEDLDQYDVLFINVAYYFLFLSSTICL